VLSTSHYDMYPNAIQEGLAHGLPVIVPHHAPPEVHVGAAEVVSAADAGLLHDRGRSGALAAALNKLPRGDALAAQLGACALSVARERAGWDNCVDAIVGGVSAAPSAAKCGSENINRGQAVVGAQAGSEMSTWSQHPHLTSTWANRMTAHGSMRRSSVIARCCCPMKSEIGSR